MKTKYLKLPSYKAWQRALEKNALRIHCENFLFDTSTGALKLAKARAQNIKAKKIKA